MKKLTLRPNGKVIEIEEGKNILQACRENDIFLKSSCGGHATCSDCVIKVVSGEDNLTPAPFNELKLLGNVFHITKERLACQTCLTGDVTIDISKHDKDAIESKMKSKNNSFQKSKVSTKVRKPDEIQEKYQEREKIRQEKKVNQDTWQKHWEKDQAGNPKKKLDGNRRPKLFSTDGLENMVNQGEKDQNYKDKKRPLPKKELAHKEVSAESVQTKYSSEESVETSSEFKSFRNKK